FSVTDQFGAAIATGSGPASSDSQSIAVSVTAVSDAVSASAPATLTAAEDGSTAITGLSISDVDASFSSGAAGLYSVTLSVGDGKLTLGTTSGLTFDAGANGTASLTFHGTLADINAALATASYLGNADFNGADAIAFSVTDDVGGVVATG